MTRPFVLAAAFSFAAVAASAQTTSPPAAPTPGHEVQGLTVAPGPGPKVAATYPVDGGAAPGGVIILKITFDQPMAPDAWSYGRSAGGGDFPSCLVDPRLLSDKRTYVLLCTVAPGAAYAVDINAAPRFASAGADRSAAPYTLKFTTTADITRGLPDALAQAGLTPQDDPIMTWHDPGKGVSQSADPGS